MSFKDSMLKLLNLDGIGDEPKGKRAAKSRPAPSTPAEPGVSPWKVAERNVAAAAQSAETPWQTERPDAGRKWYFKLLRTVAIVALLVVVLVGLRAMFFPATSNAKPTTTTAAPFPAADGRGVAERFAESYLTWSAEDPKSRYDALAVDMAGLAEDNLAGWDGTGKQEASGARALSIDAADSTHAIVTVIVKVQAYLEDGTAEPAAWTGLAVPVELVNGRMVVTAPPATVGVPAPVVGERTQAPNADRETTEGTEDYAATFFAAYATESNVDALTAPEAGIAGLAGLVELDSLKEWTVYEGEGDTRRARAVVRWITEAGTVIEQPYSLGLIEVTAGSTSRWQIESITGASR